MKGLETTQKAGRVIVAIAATLGFTTWAVAAPKSIVATAVEAGSFETLVTAVKAAGLVDALNGEGPFTVFAPTDEAFAKLPEGTVEALVANPEKLKAILTYHVVPGKVMAADVTKITAADTLFGQQLAINTSEGVMVGGANVVTTDIECSNGVIHVIDSVMMPKDIVDIAASNADFSTLVAALKAGGLVETLQGDGPFTVFAPTNAAFAKVPQETVASLLQPENKDQLVSILTYHVVPGRVLAEDVVGLKSATTVQGSALPIEVKKAADGSVKGVMVGGAKVISTDIIGLNGVIHVVDGVLMPE